MSDLRSDSCRTIAEEIATEQDCDVLVYNGPIGRPADEELISECIRRRLRSRVLLMMVTEGGDPDAGYRVARCLQEKYEHISFYVSGYCKSSGTLIALGANELIFSMHGELGPLDIQLAKKDELFDRQSGLTVMAALEAIKDKAFNAFEDFFFQIQNDVGGLISVPTASQVSHQIIDSIFGPISKQIDPMHLGEVARSLKIAEQYGIRLVDKSKITTLEKLRTLYTYYPSHGFVIDKAESHRLFTNVREPSRLEVQLAESLGDVARRPRSKAADVFFFLTKEPPKSEITATQENAHERQQERPVARSADDERDSEGTGEGSVSAKEQEKSRKGKRPKPKASASEAINGQARESSG